MSRAPAWSETEDAILRECNALGLDPAETAARLPRHRTQNAIKTRRTFLGIRERRDPLSAKRLRRPAPSENTRLACAPRDPKVVLAPAALAERDRAYAAPRTVEQVLLGDPLPGRSALDRMRDCEAAQGERTGLSSHHPAWSPRAW